MEKVINSFTFSRALARSIDLLSRSKLSWTAGQSGLDFWLEGYSCSYHRAKTGRTVTGV